jgi:hypothetical protein
MRSILRRIGTVSLALPVVVGGTAAAAAAGDTVCVTYAGDDGSAAIHWNDPVNGTVTADPAAACDLATSIVGCVWTGVVWVCSGSAPGVRTVSVVAVRG